MSDNPLLVSIVLCTYNGERFLQEQLVSLVNQTYRPIEIVILDDCSTDGTYTLLKEYQQKYPTIRLYQNEENIGYVKNFNRAIGLCKGDYIALCDQDDLWDWRKIATLVQRIQPHVLIYHDSQFMDEEGRLMDKKLSDVVNFYEGDEPETFVFFNCVSSHAVMFKKELVNYLLPFPASGFHDAWIGYVACNFGTITFLNQCLVHYRQHHHSATDILKRKKRRITTDKSRRFNNHLAFLKSCAEFPANKSPETILELYRLYKERRHKLFSFSLMFFFFKHYRTMLFIYKKGFVSKFNFIIKHCKKVKLD